MSIIKKIVISDENENNVFYPKTAIDCIDDNDRLLLKSNIIDLQGVNSCNITLTDNTIYVCNPNTSLTITTATDINNFDSCVVYFTYVSGATVTVTIPSSIVCSGSNCASNIFTPVSGFKYTLGFYKDTSDILCIIDAAAL